MLYVKEIGRDQAVTFIREYSNSIQQEKSKYLYLGVFNGSNALVALQEYEVGFAGYCTKDKPEHIHLVSLYKIPGTEHGVFKAVFEYIKRFKSGTKIYLESYEDKLTSMYRAFNFKAYNKNYPHFMVNY